MLILSDTKAEILTLMLPGQCIYWLRWSRPFLRQRREGHNLVFHWNISTFNNYWQVSLTPKLLACRQACFYSMWLVPSLYQHVNEKDALPQQPHTWNLQYFIFFTLTLILFYIIRQKMWSPYDAGWLTVGVRLDDAAFPKYTVHLFNWCKCT